MILMEITNLKESGHVGERVEAQWLMRLAGVLISGSASTCPKPRLVERGSHPCIRHHFSRVKARPFTSVLTKKVARILMGVRLLVGAYFPWIITVIVIDWLSRVPSAPPFTLSRRAVTRRRVAFEETHTASMSEQSLGKANRENDNT
jgi:hypothetical protein